jgi:hypothetical protein
MRGAISGVWTLGHPILNRASNCIPPGAPSGRDAQPYGDFAGDPGRGSPPFGSPVRIRSDQTFPAPRQGRVTAVTTGPLLRLGRRAGSVEAMLGPPQGRHRPLLGHG